jgi:hypothetical protein
MPTMASNLLMHRLSAPTAMAGADKPPENKKGPSSG